MALSADALEALRRIAALREAAAAPLPARPASRSTHNLVPPAAATARSSSPFAALSDAPPPTTTTARTPPPLPLPEHSVARDVPHPLPSHGRSSPTSTDTEGDVVEYESGDERPNDLDLARPRRRSLPSPDDLARFQAALSASRAGGSSGTSGSGSRAHAHRPVRSGGGGPTAAPLPAPTAPPPQSSTLTSPISSVSAPSSRSDASLLAAASAPSLTAAASHREPPSGPATARDVRTSATTVGAPAPASARGRTAGGSPKAAGAATGSSRVHAAPPDSIMVPRSLSPSQRPVPETFYAPASSELRERQAGPGRRGGGVAAAAATTTLTTTAYAAAAPPMPPAYPPFAYVPYTAHLPPTAWPYPPAFAMASGAHMAWPPHMPYPALPPPIPTMLAQPPPPAQLHGGSGLAGASTPQHRSGPSAHALASDVHPALARQPTASGVGSMSLGDAPPVLQHAASSDSAYDGSMASPASPSTVIGVMTSPEPRGPAPPHRLLSPGDAAGPGMASDPARRLTTPAGDGFALTGGFVTPPVASSPHSPHSSVAAGTAAAAAAVPSHATAHDLALFREAERAAGGRGAVASRYAAAAAAADGDGDGDGSNLVRLLQPDMRSPPAQLPSGDDEPAGDPLALLGPASLHSQASNPALAAFVQASVSRMLAASKLGSLMQRRLTRSIAAAFHRWRATAQAAAAMETAFQLVHALADGGGAVVVTVPDAVSPGARSREGSPLHRPRSASPLRTTVSGGGGVPLTRAPDGGSGAAAPGSTPRSALSSEGSAAPLPSARATLSAAEQAAFTRLVSPYTEASHRPMDPRVRSASSFSYGSGGHGPGLPHTMSRSHVTPVVGHVARTYGAAPFAASVVVNGVAVAGTGALSTPRPTVPSGGSITPRGGVSTPRGGVGGLSAAAPAPAAVPAAPAAGGGGATHREMRPSVASASTDTTAAEPVTEDTLAIEPATAAAPADARAAARSAPAPAPAPSRRPATAVPRTRLAVGAHPQPTVARQPPPPPSAKPPIPSRAEIMAHVQLLDALRGAQAQSTVRSAPASAAKPARSGGAGGSSGRGAASPSRAVPGRYAAVAGPGSPASRGAASPQRAAGAVRSGGSGGSGSSPSRAFRRLSAHEVAARPDEVPRLTVAPRPTIAATAPASALPRTAGSPPRVQSSTSRRNIAGRVISFEGEAAARMVGVGGAVPPIRPSLSDARPPAGDVQSVNASVVSGQRDRPASPMRTFAVSTAGPAAPAAVVRITHHVGHPGASPTLTHLGGSATGATIRAGGGASGGDGGVTAYSFGGLLHPLAAVPPATPLEPEILTVQAGAPVWSNSYGRSDAPTNRVGTAGHRRGDRRASVGRESTVAAAEARNQLEATLQTTRVGGGGDGAAPAMRVRAIDELGRPAAPSYSRGELWRAVARTEHRSASASAAARRRSPAARREGAAAERDEAPRLSPTAATRISSGVPAIVRASGSPNPSGRAMTSTAVSGEAAVVVPSPGFVARHASPKQQSRYVVRAITAVSPAAPPAPAAAAPSLLSAVLRGGATGDAAAHAMLTGPTRAGSRPRGGAVVAPTTAGGHPIDESGRVLAHITLRSEAASAAPAQRSRRRSVEAAPRVGRAPAAAAPPVPAPVAVEEVVRAAYSDTSGGGAAGAATATLRDTAPGPTPTSKPLRAHVGSGYTRAEAEALRRSELGLEASSAASGAHTMASRYAAAGIGTAGIAARSVRVTAAAPATDTGRLSLIEEPVSELRVEQASLAAAARLPGLRAADTITAMQPTLTYDAAIADLTGMSHTSPAAAAAAASDGVADATDSGRLLYVVHSGGSAATRGGGARAAHGSARARLHAHSAAPAPAPAAAAAPMTYMAKLAALLPSMSPTRMQARAATAAAPSSPRGVASHISRPPGALQESKLSERTRVVRETRIGSVIVRDVRHEAATADAFGLYASGSKRG